MGKKFERWWRYHFGCSHKSHLLGLPCYRPRAYDHYCQLHNASCYYSCEV